MPPDPAGREERRLRPGCLSFSQDGKRLLTAGHAKAEHEAPAKLWNVEDLLKAPLATRPLVGLHGQGTLLFWGLTGEKPARRAELPGHPASPEPKQGGSVLGSFNSWLPEAAAAGHVVVAFDPLGRRLATTGTQGRIFLWGVKTGKRQHTWQTPQRTWERHRPADPVDLAFAPDGRHLALGNANGTIWLIRLPEDE